MSTLTDARALIADAVTSAGILCEPYPPDTLSPPAAFVDTITVDYMPGAGWSYCESGMATATVVACGLRNDRAGTTRQLEDLIKPTLDALHDLNGLRVTGVQSGTTEIGGATLPAVIYTAEFAISN